MSPFEAACWNWYQENAGGFSMESGAAGLELYVTGRRLGAGARRLFKRAVEQIYQVFERVGLERAKAARKEG